MICLRLSSVVVYELYMAYPEVGVDISSIGIYRRGLITKTFASTKISYSRGKKPVLTRILDPFMDEYRSGILATDDITEVRVYTSSI